MNSDTTAKADAVALFSGAGEVRSLARDLDWSLTAIGPTAEWSPAIRTLARSIFDSPFPMCLWVGRQYALLYNDAYRQILAAKHPAALGQPGSLVWAEIWGQLQPQFDSVRAGGAPIHFEDAPFVMARLESGGTETAWFNYSLSALRDDEGSVVAILNISPETTDHVLLGRRLAEEQAALAVSEAAAKIDEQRVQLALSAGAILGTWFWDIPGDRFTSDEPFARAFGLNPAAAREGIPLADVFATVHPDDRAGLSAAIEDASVRGGAYAHQYRVRRSDENDYHWIEANGRVDLATDGTPLSFPGVLIDIGQRREVQAALLASEEFARRVLESSVDCIKVLDLDARFEFMSEGGMCVMEVEDFGAIKGACWPDLWLGNEHAKAVAAVDQAKRGGVGRFQGFATTMKGTPRWWDVVVTPINGADGKPAKLLSVSRDVTEQREATERLRELNADLERQVIERTQERGRTWVITPDMLSVIDLATGMFDRVNPAWTTTLGWSASELECSSFADFVHPDDLAASYDGLAVLERGEPLLFFENRYRTKKGPYRWVRWVAVPENGKLYSTTRDVTDEKVQAAELSIRTAERDRMWETSPDLMLVIDFAGVFRRVNPAWTTVLGYAADDLVGHHVNEFVLPEDHDETVDAYELAAAGGLPVIVNQYRHKDGSVRWISWSAAPADDRMTYATGRDITADRRRSVELDAAQEALRQSQKLEAIGQLTGGVAHDFNNLLTVIRGSADLLRRGNLTEEKRARYIDAIGDTAERAAKLTGQLLAFARRQSLSADLFDVGESLSDVATMLRTLTGSRIVLDLQLPSEPFFIVADKSQFDTAIVNMGINARDAMSGEGRLTISTGPVSGIPEIRSHPAVASDFIAVTLADNGTGIAANQLASIFEPFFTTKGVGQGTGLGLSQVFGFAKQSGGDIRVDSTPGEGTVFTLYLPRAPDDAAPTVKSAVVERADGGGRCVLVVEDNEDVGVFATAAINDLGYETLFAADAQAALAVLATEGHRINAVFSDVVMPGMSGIELAQEVRRLRPELPVVLTSGYSHVLAQNGRHGFELLHKPYSIEQLSRVLYKAVSWNAEKASQS